MESILVGVNWTAVGFGTVLSFIAGALWYSDLMFGKPWRAGIGVSEDDQTPMWHAMVTQFGSTFLLAWAISVAIAASGIYFALLIGFTAAGLIKANGFFSQKSMYAVATEVGFVLVMVVVMIGVHAVV